MTDALITRLADDLKPVRAGHLVARLTLAGLLGGAISLAGIAFILGPRPDLLAALGGPMFWIKLAYALALGAVTAFGLTRLARPGGRVRGWGAWLAVPVVLMAVFAVSQIVTAPPPERLALLMGSSARLCPFLIAACAAPIFIALTFAVRGLAPTRLRLAGAAVGLASGAFGAALYALHCDEAGGAFVVIWYSLGIALAAAIGALLGPRVLRWR